MNLKERITKDTIEALKKKNETEVSVLRMLSSAIKNAEIEAKKELSDEETVQILTKQAKQRKEAIEEYKKAGREELAEKEEKELKIIEEYLPEKMSEEEILKIVEEIVSEQKPEGMGDFGKIMGAAMAKLKGKADGNTVSEAVKKALSGK